MSDTSYIGTSTPKQYEYTVHICNGGTVLNLPLRNDLRNHSPDGFAWGYNGSGPAQLALALLADATGKDELALRYYHKYKNEIVATLSENWQINISHVSDWVRRQERLRHD